MEGYSQHLTAEVKGAAGGRLRNIARHYVEGVLTDEDLEGAVYQVLMPLGHTQESIDACVYLILEGEQL